MKRSFNWIWALLLPGLLLLSASCDTGISGNGQVAERTEEVSGFSRVVISGNFDVHLRQGDRPELRFEMDENLFDILEVRESGRTLTIETTVNILRARKKSVYLTVKDLEKLDLSGAVNIDGNGTIETGSLSIYSAGAVRIDLVLQADRLRLDLSGASDCNLQGKTDELEVSLTGAGDLHAIDLFARVVNLDLSGAGHARVYASEKLDVDISGVGSVRYRGDPAHVNKNISGLGSLKQD